MLHDMIIPSVSNIPVYWTVLKTFRLFYMRSYRMEGILSANEQADEHMDW